MTQTKVSRRQLLFGFFLGLLLLPVPFLLESWFLGLNHRELGGLEAIVDAVLYFGAVQACVVLPASLLFHLEEKDGVVRGLLYLGILAAVCNVALWVAVFAGIFNPRIY
jgi:hypothetical protein